MLKDLKLSKKLFLGLGIIAVVSTAIMITAIVNLYSVGGLINKLYQSPVTVSTQSIMVQKGLQSTGREIRGMVLYEDTSYYDSALTSINKGRESLALVDTRFLGNQQLIQDMYQNLDELEVKGKEIKQLVADGKMEEAKPSAGRFHR